MRAYQLEAQAEAEAEWCGAVLCEILVEHLAEAGDGAMSGWMAVAWSWR